MCLHNTYMGGFITTNNNSITVNYTAYKNILALINVTLFVLYIKFSMCNILDYCKCAPLKH